jgi:hypothetical protein
MTAAIIEGMAVRISSPVLIGRSDAGALAQAGAQAPRKTRRVRE